MRIVSLPFTDYCSILADDYDSEMEICRDLIQEGKIRGCILEIRNPTVMTETFKSCSYYKQHLLRLNEDPKAVFGNCDKKTIQYNIRKAQKAGIVVKEWNSDYGIRELYKLMNITRKRHGVPTQPKQYFDNIKKNIITPGLGSIFLASYNDRAIAAGLFLYHKNIVIYKYNASDCKNSGNLTPNHLLTWEAIRNACARGYGVLDFGRTSPDNAGLMRYKQMWGATAFALPYSFFPTVKSPSLVSESGNAYRLLRTVWRYLPMSITDILGKVLYRYTA